MEKLVEYMGFKAHYESMGSKEEIPVNDFMERIPPEIVLELSVLIRLRRFIYSVISMFFSLYRLLAADYQECESLIYFYDLTSLVHFV